MTPQFCPFCQSKLTQSSAQGDAQYCNNKTCCIGPYWGFIIWSDAQNIIYAWKANVKIDDRSYVLYSRQPHALQFTYTLLRTFGSSEELEVPQYFHLPENNIKEFLYSLTQQLLNLKSFI